MKMVLVNWVDSNIMHGWRLAGEHTEDSVAECQTIGFLEREDENKIVLVMGTSNLGSVIESFIIPKPCIKSIRKLRVQ